MNKEYLQHPYGAIYLDMSEAEFQTFCQDIRDNGFLNSTVLLLEGQILDGWHRYRVALTLNRVDELTFENYDGDSPFRYIHSLNQHRRHLTPAQRAVIGIRHTKMLKVGNVKAQDSTTSPDQITFESDVVEDSGRASAPPKSAAKVAEETGTSVDTNS